MNLRLIRILTILAITAMVAACKLEVVAVQGGDIEWSEGSCLEGSNCVVEITDPNYSSSFTVTPRPGYQFVKWQNAPGFLCGDSTNPICKVAMPADATHAAAIIGVSATVYIMPIYKGLGRDTDGDGTQNELDADDDNDGVNDEVDNCPVNAGIDGYGCPVSYRDACPCVAAYPGGWAGLVKGLAAIPHLGGTVVATPGSCGADHPLNYSALRTPNENQEIPDGLWLPPYVLADPRIRAVGTCNVVTGPPLYMFGGLLNNRADLTACQEAVARLRDLDPLQICP